MWSLRRVASAFLQDCIKQTLLLSPVVRSGTAGGVPIVRMGLVDHVWRILLAQNAHVAAFLCLCRWVHPSSVAHASLRGFSLVGGRQFLCRDIYQTFWTILHWTLFTLIYLFIIFFEYCGCCVDSTCVRLVILYIWRRCVIFFVGLFGCCIIVHDLLYIYLLQAAHFFSSALTPF